MCVGPHDPRAQINNILRIYKTIQSSQWHWHYSNTLLGNIFSMDSSKSICTFPSVWVLQWIVMIFLEQAMQKCSDLMPIMFVFGGEHEGCDWPCVICLRCFHFACLIYLRKGNSSGLFAKFPLSGAMFLNF